jgi:2-haloalkanoic acid dehalogenase type II
VDWPALADAWRARYQPQLETVRRGTRPWTKLDVLQREALDQVLADFALDAVLEADRTDFNLVWHRLAPWPDTVEGLRLLKRRFIIAPNSNGHIALVLNLSKCAGLPWDAILGSEFARAYKPAPEAYLRNVEAIGLSPPEVMMVAAHNGDLFAAGACPPPARPGAPGSQPGTGPGHHPPPARRGRLGRPPAGHWSPAGRHASLGRRGDNQAVQVPGGLTVATQQANRARDRERELRQHQQRRHGWLEANAHLGP